MNDVTHSAKALRVGEKIFRPGDRFELNNVIFRIRKVNPKGELIVRPMGAFVEETE